MAIVAMGNGVYNKDGVIIDYNGKQGRHPRQCNCNGIKCMEKLNSHINQPQPISKGVNNTMANQPDVAIITALASNPDALNAYMAQFNPSTVPVTPQPVSIAQPIVQPEIAPIINPTLPILNEYEIPLVVSKGKGKDAMVKLSDGRTHAVGKFTNGMHDFRFNPIYGDSTIVGESEWVLKVVRKS